MWNRFTEQRRFTAPAPFGLKAPQCTEPLLPPHRAAPGRLPCAGTRSAASPDAQNVPFPTRRNLVVFLLQSVPQQLWFQPVTCWRCLSAAVWRKDCDGEVAALSWSWGWGWKPAQGFSGLRWRGCWAGGADAVHGADSQLNTGIRLHSWSPGAVQLSGPLQDLSRVPCSEPLAQDSGTSAAFPSPAAEIRSFSGAGLEAPVCFLQPHFPPQKLLFLGCQILFCLNSRRRQMKHFKANTWE